MSRTPFTPHAVRMVVAAATALVAIAAQPASSRAQADPADDWQAVVEGHLRASYDPVEIKSVEPNEAGDGAVVDFRGIGADGRRCEGTTAVHREASGYTFFDTPPTCFVPWAELITESAPSLLPLATACDAMDHAACGDLMFALFTGEGLPHPPYDEVLLFTVPGCEAGHARACAVLSRALLHPELLGRAEGANLEEAERAFRAAQLACDAGVALGCVSLATLVYMDLPFSPPNRQGAIDLLQPHCDAGDVESCIAIEQLGALP